MVAQPKLSMAKCRKNVESFLEACRRMGVEQVRRAGGGVLYQILIISTFYIAHTPDQCVK